MVVAMVAELLTPIEAVETLAAQHQWEMDRKNEDERVIFVEGRYDEYEVAFSWLEDEQVLNVACAFDFALAKGRSNADMHELVRQLNATLWIGHFDWWSDSKLVLLRHGIVQALGEQLSVKQIYLVMAKLLETCENHYASFNFLNEGKTVKDALDLNIGATEGTA